MFFQIWLCFYFLQALVLSDQKCWKTDDLGSKKDGFLRCRNSIIALMDVKINEESVNQRYCYRSKLQLQQLSKCNGLQNVCDISDVDFLDIIKKFVDDCYYGSASRNVCIIYDCIPGQVNYLMDRAILNKAIGRVYKATQLSGFLRCSIYGYISNVTVFALSSSDITVRDGNGSRIIDHNQRWYKLHYNGFDYYMSRYCFTELRYCLVSDLPDTVFAYTKRAINTEGVEITIYSHTVQDITFIVEGGINYRCRTGVEKQEVENEIFAVNDNDKWKWIFKEQLPWITTSLSLMLSLVLSAVFVAQCLLQRRSNKGFSVTKSPTDPSSRRPLENNYDSPHLYMDISV